MPFVRDTWADGPSGNTPIVAAKLNNIETGIVAADGTNPSSAEGIADRANWDLTNATSVNGVYSRSHLDVTVAGSDAQQLIANTYAPLIPNGENVAYVSTRGNDSSSGRSWASAKLTLTGALAVLAGNPGTIIVGVGTIGSGATSTISIPAYTTIVGQGRGSSTILHDFNGDFLTVNSSVAFAHLTINGQGNTYTGRGLIFPSASSNQKILDCMIYYFATASLYFVTDGGSGFQSVGLEAWCYNGASGGGNFGVVIDPAAQLAAKPRAFTHFSSAGQCAIDFGGCNDVFVASSFIADVNFTPDSRGVNLLGVRIANQASLTVDGHNNSIVGCDINPQVTIASAADAITVGPGSFNHLPIIDSSGNNRNTLTHWEIAYTPTLTSGGTAPSLGNGTLTGWYSRSGTQIMFDVNLTVGSTTTLGTGELRFSLPVPRTTTTITAVGSGIVLAGSTNYTAAVQVPGAVSYARLIRDTSGSVTYNSPGTLATGDTIRFTGSYMV